MFLGEMEELIDALQPSDFVKLLTSILHQLSKCVENEHFQVDDIFQQRGHVLVGHG